MDYADALAEIVGLARANGGIVLAAHVEADEVLSRARDVVCPAARALAGSTNVLSAVEPDGRDWFPYSSLIFTDLDPG